MSTVTLWLLIVVGYKNDAPHVLERFVTLEECERVRQLLPNAGSSGSARCIQARVAR